MCFRSPGRTGRPREVPQRRGVSSRDSTTFSSPEERRFLSWPLTRATDDHYGEPELVARLRPSPGGNLKRRTDRVYVPPTTEERAPLVPLLPAPAACPRVLQALEFPNGVPLWGKGGGRELVNKTLAMSGLNSLFHFYFFFFKCQMQL